MKRSYFVYLLLFLFSVSLKAEDGKLSACPDGFPITISYFGEMFTHPGIIAGCELGLVSGSGHSLFTTLNLGSYIHRRNHIPVFAAAELGYRYTFNSGFNLHVLAGAGYFHKFLDAPIFSLSDGGPVEIPNTGSPHLMVSASLGLGWNLSKKSSVPLDLFLRAQVFGEYPFNSYILLHPVLQLGTRIFLEEGKNEK